MISFQIREVAVDIRAKRRSKATHRSVAIQRQLRRQRIAAQRFDYAKSRISYELDHVKFAANSIRKTAAVCG